MHQVAANVRARPGHPAPADLPRLRPKSRRLACCGRQCPDQRRAEEETQIPRRLLLARASALSCEPSAGACNRPTVRCAWLAMPAVWPSVQLTGWVLQCSLSGLKSSGWNHVSSVPLRVVPVYDSLTSVNALSVPAVSTGSKIRAGLPASSRAHVQTHRSSD